MKWMVIVLITLLTPSLFGQIETVPATQDSIAPPEPIIPTGMVAARIDTVAQYHSTKSPGLAMLLSAVVPGAGQFYNESYWKVPVVVGLGVYFASQWLHNNRIYHDYRDQYLASITPQLPGGDGSLQSLREFYRDQRDTFTWYFFILYFVNVADAYVDASLYDFNVGDNLSIRLIPESGTRLALRVSF
jgi:hypothetical protein